MNVQIRIGSLSTSYAVHETMGTSGRAFALALLGGAATYGLWYFFTLSRDRRERRQRQRRHSGGLSPTAAALVRLGSSASGPTSPAGNQRSVQVGTTDDEDENNDDENEDEGKVVQVNESGELLGALYDIAEEMARRGSRFSLPSNSYNSKVSIHRRVHPSVYYVQPLQHVPCPGGPVQVRELL